MAWGKEKHSHTLSSTAASLQCRLLWGELEVIGAGHPCPGFHRECIGAPLGGILHSLRASFHHRARSSKVKYVMQSLSSLSINVLAIILDAPAPMSANFFGFSDVYPRCVADCFYGMPRS
ncbi:Os03g0360533 [Oryza sativa Japonica Group]|uniref:Os03g0360533 protein n=1 Tax=Oryza sativa subsp. japonica TaxID=39947 RepID=A0A0N7KHA6_ORYSJ|nr:Os03g0360533 [Oryza sativa Japonica Group]